MYSSDFYNKFTLEEYIAFDYFIRRSRADKALLEDICKNTFNSCCVDRINNYPVLNINQTHYVSLYDENLGEYAQSKDKLSPVSFDGIMENPRTYENLYEYGPNIFYLLMYKFGIKDYSSIFELFRRLGLSYNNNSRYLLSKRMISSNHQPIRLVKHFKYNVINGNELLNIEELDYKDILLEYSFKGAHFPFCFGYVNYKIYWYRTENSDIQFGVIYYLTNNGVLLKLPISQWRVRPKRVPYYLPNNKKMKQVYLTCFIHLFHILFIIKI